MNPELLVNELPGHFKIITPEERVKSKLPELEKQLDKTVELFDDILGIVYSNGLQYSDLSVLRLQLGQVYLTIKQLNNKE